MRIFTLIISLLMINTVFAATEIKGVIPKDTIFLPSRGHDDSFPNKHYDIYDLVIYRSEEPISLKSGIKIDSKSYQLIGVTAELNLVTYDKNTGYYKYRLFIEPNKMGNLNPATSGKIIPIESNVLLFDKDQKSAIFLEGKVTYVNGQPILHNINADKIGLIMEYGKPAEHRLNITALRDIPITIKLK